MKRTLLFAAISVLGCTGCNRSDGDRLARIGSKVAQKVQDLVPETPLAGSLSLTPSANLEGRVRDRFKNDRYLAPASIEISVYEGAVRLKGQVDNAILKRRAVELAESTVGVEKVVDDLIVLQ